MLALVLMASVVVTAQSLLQQQQTFRNYAKVKAVGVGVYWLNGTEVTEIDWGLLAPGENKSVVVQMINEGTVTIKLMMNTSNWDPPEAESYIDVSWEYYDTPLYPDDVFVTNMTLSVSPAIQGIKAFSFDITITGYQV
jgi:hypothetical protein